MNRVDNPATLVFAMCSAATLVATVLIVADILVTRNTPEVGAFAGRLDKLTVLDPAVAAVRKCGSAYITYNGGQTFYVRDEDIPLVYTAVERGVQVLANTKSQRLGCAPLIVSIKQWAPEAWVPTNPKAEQESLL